MSLSSQDQNFKQDFDGDRILQNVSILPGNKQVRKILYLSVSGDLKLEPILVLVTGTTHTDAKSGYKNIFQLNSVLPQ